jgi:hypothetical protein
MNWFACWFPQRTSAAAASLAVTRVNIQTTLPSASLILLQNHSLSVTLSFSFFSAMAAATTETDFQSFSTVVLKPLLQFITTECLAALPSSALDIAGFIIQLLHENKEHVNQICGGRTTSSHLPKPSNSNSESLLKCNAAVCMASKRREAVFLRRIYDQYFSNIDSKDGLSGQNLIEALTAADALNIPSCDQEAREIMERLDTNINKTLDFGHFQQLVNEPDELQLWLSEKELPLAADALRALVGRGGDQLKRMSELSSADISDAATAMCTVIPGMLKELRQELRAAFAIQSQIRAELDAHPSKFNDVSKIACGDISDFHEGVTARIGMPNLNFMNAMRQEHCERVGCDVAFTTGNYKITTTSRLEWQYVVENAPCPDMAHNRRITSTRELLKRELCKKAMLCEEEIIAIVLYTGPMFQVYNTILRRYPLETFSLFQKGDNLFSTTIFVLVSAVQKLCRVTPIPPGTQLYRGLGGRVDLPDIFFHIDDMGCSGYVEWGFLSTTSNRDVALGYSGVKERRPKAMVMVIETSSIDRGADISEFSQYPDEKEFLYLPCSFVQRAQQSAGRVTVVDGGLVTFVPVKVNLNLKTETVEELKEKKKRLHLVSARAMVEEVRYELGEWAKSTEAKERGTRDISCTIGCIGDFVQQIVWQCENVVKRHQSAGLQDYVDDGAFRALVGEVLDARAWAIEKKELWMQDSSQVLGFCLGLSLRAGHRLWQSFLLQKIGLTKQASAGLEFLKSRGLVKRGVQGELNEDGEDLLMQAGGDGWAATDIHAAAVAGADVGDCNDSSCYCVWNAARYGHAQTITALLQSKADVNKCNSVDESPIFAAAENGHFGCLQLLLSARGDVSKCTDRHRGNFCDWSPVHIAAFNGRSDCLKLLLGSGGDANKCSEDGVSPIFCAVIHGHVDCLALLLQSGGDVDRCTSNGQSPIYKAAENGHVDCLKLLLSSRADPRASLNGTSALDTARERNHAECARVLEAAMV